MAGFSNYPIPPALLTSPQASDYCGFSHRTFENWRLRGGGPPFCKLGGAVRYRLADLDRWIEDNLRESTSSDGEN
ncbi:helix-turn-helix transcriptional regulator [Desulfoferula mesophila]|uniref:Helix-turn-helix domain-containing protein n=1 Tax=Desulfoferula mesophila TaxID=3058419 RepID=A0AAU9F033_9BACT|nr:hypothetical protein FAK_23790 [Desulfoferula mesophilus]